MRGAREIDAKAVHISLITKLRAKLLYTRVSTN